MTRSSDLVMVEREVLERIEFSSNGYCPVCDGWMVDEWRGATPGKHTPTCELAKAIAALQSVEGGVQGSIATKQATDETAASVLSEALDDVSSVYDEMCIQFSGVHADDRMDSLMLRLHSALKAFGREQVGTICAHEDGCPPFGGPCPSCEPRYQYSALAQLTKTPSADHNDGNLRGLSALFVECHRCGGSGFSSPGTGYGDVCSECGGLRFLPFEAAGKRPVPSVSGNIHREQQRNTMGVTAGETAPNSSAVAETRRDVPENAGLLSGVSSAPFSSTRKDERA